MGSQILPEVIPFDKFLAESFLPEGKTLKDIGHAFELIKKAKLEKVDVDDLAAARQLISTITAEENLEAGKAGLIAKLKKEGLEGLFSSILIRLTMGESADLGSDNMLVVKGKNGHNQVFNIDISGTKIFGTRR